MAIDPTYQGYDFFYSRTEKSPSMEFVDGRIIVFKPRSVGWTELTCTQFEEDLAAMRNCSGALDREFRRVEEIWRWEDFERSLDRRLRWLLF